MSRALGGYVGHIPTPSTSAASGVWTLREASRYRRAGTWPTTGDPNFSSVSLLLHMDGSNGSTTFTDSSGTPKTVTANGNAQISTAQSKFGGASCLLDGNGDYLQVAWGSAFDLSTGDFTIELWAYPITQANGGALLAEEYNADSQVAFAIAFADSSTVASTGGSTISFGSYGTSWTGVTSTQSLAVGEWSHVAVSRVGTTTTIYLNGVSIGSGTSSPLSSGSQLFIGRRWDDDGTSDFFHGYIDELRITKGVARYTSAFTPPTAPFPDA